VKQSFQAYCRKIFHHPSGTVSLFIDGFIAFLIIFSVALTPLYFIDYFSYLKSSLFLVEMGIVIIFTIEYLFRIWSAKSRKKYLFSWMGIVDLLSILSFYIGLFIVIPHLFVGG